MTEIRVTDCVAATHPSLPGHFPGNPVVPAVVLLERVERALGQALGAPLAIRALPAVKFTRPITPGQAFEIALVVDAAAGGARFRVSVGGAECAQGRLEYVVHAPGALAATTPAATSRWETQQERATMFWSRLLAWIALRLGRPVARFFLYPTALYFWASSPAVRAASRDYLRRVLPRAPTAPEPTALDVLRHIFCFATVSLDRIFILSGRQAGLSVQEDRPAEVARVADSGRGCLLFTSHLGGYESMRMTGTQWLHLPLKILMDRQHGRRLHALFDALNLSMSALVIDSDQGGPALALEVKQALESGHMVCVNADRYRGDERTVTVDFLGAPVRLPAGPWLLAHTLKAPVIIGFGLYRGGGRYENRFELFAERIEIPRDRRDAALREIVQRYADRLAHHARSAPYNWFNFYDYWA